MSRPRTSLYLVLWLAISAPPVVLAQQPAPPGLPPLFLREEWRQRERPADAPANFVPEAGVTPAAVTNSNLEVKLYDPNAKSTPVTGSSRRQDRSRETGTARRASSLGQGPRVRRRLGPHVRWC
jgi:hypothetical protein